MAYVYLGLLINPKTKDPVHAFYDDTARRVKIYGWADGDLGLRGEGYYDDEKEGCPRTHTPAGVSPKGMGFGTVLYCAMAMGAMYRMNEDADSACVHSVHGDRSGSADDWWEAAVNMDLAEDTTIGDYVTFEDEDWDDYLDGSGLAEWGAVDDIHDWSLRVSGVRGGERDANVLRVENILEHGLIALFVDVSRQHQTVTTNISGFRSDGYIEVEPYDGEFGNIEWPTDEEEAAPLLAMNKDNLSPEFKNYLREFLMERLEFTEAQVDAAGYAPTPIIDPSQYQRKELRKRLSANPSDIPEVLQVKRIWRNLSKLPG